MSAALRGTPRILLVGAGAVGQVYGFHLARAGAHVAFLVRPKHVAACEAGTTLYPLRSRHAREPVTFRADRVLSSYDDVKKETWDQVWLCIPSDAVTDALLDELLPAIGDALVVALPPGADTAAKLAARVPKERLVPALIGMVSYQAPLPGEVVQGPGIAFIVPRLAPSAFAGPHGRAIADLLKKGGCPAIHDEHTDRRVAFGSAVLMSCIVAIEGAGWSLRRFRQGPMAKLAADAAREALGIVAARLHTRPPFFRPLLRGVVVRLVWWLAPRFVPLDLEAYVHHHFSKVRPQTRLLVAGYLDAARELGQTPDALARLAHILDETP